MKKKRNILLIIFVIFLIGCASYNNRIQKKFIQGIWAFESEINKSYIKDTTFDFKHRRPIVFDFKKNNILQIRKYGIKDTVFNVKWYLKSDSILNIDSLNYKIYKLNKNKFSIMDFTRVDTVLLNFKKPRNTKIKYSKSEIENILLSNIWKNKDGRDSSEYNSSEFFKNKSMVYRYKMSKTDSIEYLQNENWGIAEYQNYYFLYYYSDYFLGKGNWEQINQILKIAPNHFSVEDDNNTSETHFYRKTSNVKKPNIIGNWTSKNSNSKNYGDFIYKLDIERGDTELFEGELKIKINKQFIEFELDSLKVGKYEWELGKDNKTILMKKQYEGELRKGFYIILADIIENEEKEFKLHLFENQFLTGYEKPRLLIINKIQEFKKQKN